MLEYGLLFLFGGIGAAFYGFPVYIVTRKSDSEGVTAVLMLLFALAVGSVFGGILTPFVGHKYPWTVDPIPYPLALGLGLLANPLLPLIVERGTALFNSFRVGGPKT